jgi:hypothetical protein
MEESRDKETIKDWFAYGQIGEVAILKLLGDRGIEACFTDRWFGPTGRGKLYENSMNKRLGDILVSNFGGIDVKRGDSFISVDSAKDFAGKYFVLISDDLSEESIRVLPAQPVKAYMKKVEPKNLKTGQSGKLGYRFSKKMNGEITWDRFIELVKESQNGS